MPDVTVHPHGNRWAVREAGSESPVKEFPTREAAELAARQAAGVGTVRMLDRDPTGLGGATPSEPAESGLDEIKAVDAPERARSPQAGL